MISQSSGRHRINMEEYSAEEEALSIISEAADIRLAAKKAVIVEAKEILLKEIEKRLKESELEPEEICKDSAHAVAGVELEKKYKAAMVNNAQLDSENQSLVYQVESLKDQLEERDEEHTELQRHYKEKCREYDFQKRDLKKLEQELNALKQQLEITNRLLAESGFIILVNDKGEPVLEKSSQVNLNTSNGVFPGNAVPVSSESHNHLRKAEETTPDTADVAVKKSDSIHVSSSVDEVDGSTFAKVSDLSTDDAVDGGRLSSRNKSLGSQNDIVSVHQETESSSLGEENADAAHEVLCSTSARLEVEPNNGLVDDEVDEFFDAVSTPSPSSKTGSYDEQGVYDQTVSTDASEGSSVDPEIRIKETPTYTSSEPERQSILLENVTETESSTDIIDETEEQDVKESITEAECYTDTTYQNENIDPDSLKEVIEGKEEQSVLLETSENSVTEVGDCSDEESASVDNVVEEATSENKPKEENNLENGETGETLEHLNKDSQEHFCDILHDAGPSDAEASQEGKVVDVQNISDINELLSCEVPDSTSVVDVSLESNVPVPCLSEETLHLHTDKQEGDEDVAEERGDTESVEISETLGAEGTTEVKDTQDVVEEAGITESIVHDSEDISSVTAVEALDMLSTTVILPDDASEKPGSENITEKEKDETEQLSQSTHNLDTENKEEGEENLVSGETEGGDSKVTGFEENTSCDVIEEAGITESIVHDGEDISSVNAVEALDMPSTTVILPDDASEKPGSENITEKEEDETEQLSQSTHNLNTENKEESEENLVSGETEGGDSKVTGFEENTSCSVEHVAIDNIEENECAEDTDYPVRDSSKLVVRTASIGGSEASEGAVIDDYDLDDIDDVLNTDAPSPAGANLNTAPSNEAEVPVLAATELVDQENKSNAKSPSKIVVEMDEGCKAKGSKKSKSEKAKAGKKSGTEKAEKIKSGEKESKDKAEKTKHKESKEKTEKSKSSKKDSSHEKKAEKSKSKKDVSQDSKRESVSGEEDKHSIAESITSLEPDDLEGALDKQMLESEKLKSSKKSSKKMSIFKKVFK